MSGKKNDGQAGKVKWVIKNYYDKGKSRPEAVKGLIDHFGCSSNYARTIIYNLLCYLNWKRAPYPKNRKAPRKKVDDHKKEKIKEKFKPIIESDPLPPKEGEIEDDFKF